MRCLGLTLGSGSSPVCSRLRYLGIVFRRRSAFERGTCRSVSCRVCLKSVPGFEDLFILFLLFFFFFFCKLLIVCFHCTTEKRHLRATNFWQFPTEFASSRQQRSSALSLKQLFRQLSRSSFFFFFFFFCLNAYWCYSLQCNDS
ncbi:hypothetical protein IscW_ISCW018313 [Ixodes scapularis]|uniref:Uncharacterized protein n=1 Tax=Ixodes scapularis TaxID=6945 RepID=B7PGU2_IXOSC|nr:hypothetical protein IscW_ISCW018313 [Ixodes scapularis]|eukprot:XP_002401451.1 hypothetical protein IscW_ISCW018313 [Ixodes scapularis]